MALFEIDDVDLAIRTFVAWAGGRDDVRLLFTPDVLLSIDTPPRQGYLIDEVYFATIWVGRGAPDLRAELHRQLGPPGSGWSEEPSTARPDPAEFLAFAARHGHPLPNLRN